jgi:hypothetical protein
MNETAKDLLCISLIVAATLLLVWGVLMAYEDWSVLLGIMILLVGWILVSLIRMMLRTEAEKK